MLSAVVDRSEHERQGREKPLSPMVDRCIQTMTSDDDDAE